MRPVINEEKFISELYLRLLWKCSKKERMEIIHDMKEYFEIAFSNGTTEIEICEELGSPKDVIRRIAKEGKQEEPDDTYTFEWLVRCIAVFAYLAIWGFMMIPFGKVNLLMLPILMPVECILLWYTIGGKFFCRACLMEKEQIGFKKIIVFHFLYFIVSLLAAFYFYNAALDCQKWMWFVKEASEYGPYLRNILLMLVVLFAVMYIRNIYSFYRCSIEWYSLAIHAIGSVYMIIAFMYMRFLVTDPVLIIPIFTECMLIYAEGVILSLGFLYYSHNLIKREGL